MKPGPNYIGNNKFEFVVWAPLINKVELKIISPEEHLYSMEKDYFGYWRIILENITPDTLYLYRLNEERDRPDPASFYQPTGVHGPSQIIDHISFTWDDEQWRVIDISKIIIYEIHVGTFTPQGTFEAIIPRLDELLDLGINTIELMPVAQFPGERNWGYDGTYPYAVQNSYGGPDGLKKLVNECHKKQIGVFLDVVYNHLGPEGNYLWDFGPYFTTKYKTSWGDAINYDDEYSDGVRNFFIENALNWFENFHIDGLRLDAVHGIIDTSACPFLLQLVEKVNEFSNRKAKKYYLIAESDLNDNKIVKPKDIGGYGIDAQWSDDFHHALHTILTGEQFGYYQDFGKIEHLSKSLKEGFVFSGEYSEYRKRTHGNSSKDIPAFKLITFIQNHDQVGNRMLGERISSLVSFEEQKLSASVLFLSPYVPLLFMGEEYGENNPFFYFISHIDQNLIEAVRKGRIDEYKSFKWKGVPPDPHSTETFLTSKLIWEKRFENNHKALLNYYKELIKIRKRNPAISNLNKENLILKISGTKKNLLIKRWYRNHEILCVFNFSGEDSIINFKKEFFELSGTFWKILDSSDILWNGPGSLSLDELSINSILHLRGYSIVLYEKELKKWQDMFAYMVIFTNRREKIHG